MRRASIALSIALSCLTPAFAQLSINFGSPAVSVGINLGAYPTLQRIPGYPVYYAPGVNSNYFFYDGLYWVYDGNDWFESSWYNGPWYRVDPFDVPVYLLRVPVRYYRHAPAYFRGWRSDDAPRWGEHWGQSWAQRRGGWDQWDHRSSPAPAPLPTYQRQYTGSRYPQGAQQATLATQNYRYQPHDAVARQHFQHERTQAQSAPQQQAAPAQQAQRTRQERSQQPQQQQTPQAAQSQPQNPAARSQDGRQQAHGQQQQQQQQQQRQPQPQPQQQPQARPQQNEHKQEQPKEHGQGEGRGKGHEKDNNDQRG
jgi:hypothetical protein